jgi:hypothetical protein
MRGCIVHTNAVAAVQPNVAPDSMSLRCELSWVLAWNYSLNALKKVVLMCIYRDIWDDQ